MKKRLVITDLTRMRDERVCIFGIDKEGNGIRPVLPSGVDENYVIKNDIKPFNEIEFDLISLSKLRPPHTEDWMIMQRYKPRFIRRISSDEQKDILEKTEDNSVKEIFGAEIHECRYVNEGEGDRSIGTVKAENIEFIDYLPNEERKFNYKMRFSDQDDCYDLPITDLCFRNYCDYLRIHEHLEPEVISADLLHKLNKALVFLRVGLTRPFKKRYNRCYLQVSGVYAFPDYLEKGDYYRLESQSEREKWQIRDTTEKSIERSERRADSLFPFPLIRTGQKEMLADVQETIKSQGVLIAHAPTGIGKTAAAIVPALEYAIKNDKIVFFLTSKQSHHKIVVDTLRLIKNTKNVNFTAIDIISKQAMCPRGIAKEYYTIFNELCKLGQKTGECKYFSNYNKNVVHRITENILHVEELKDICTSNGVCPHKTAMNVSANAHVLICDYNYVFSDILETILDKTKHSLSDIILIIDEAHNLPMRIRDHLSHELTLNTLKEVTREVKSANVEYRIIHNYLTGIAKFFNKFAEDMPQVVEQNIEKEVIVSGINKALSESLEPIDYDTFVQMLKHVSTEIKEREDGISYATNVAEFLDGWNTDLPCSRVFSNSPPTFSSKLLDPSIISRDIISNAYATIMMSGTLYPVEMYADILGARKEKTVLREYESPFPKENRLIVVTKGLTTLYEMRSKSMYRNIAGKISKIADVVENTVHGNVAVFFPSYTLLNNVAKYFPEEMNRRILIERRNMSKRQKNQLYNQLREACGRLLMGVQAGSLSEGMDYEDNMLKAVIIVGLPLSPPTLDVKNLKKYYADKFGREKGMLYGYIYPAISKVLQAAGRCIRSETDIGAIILMDSRFSVPNYMKCLPPDYEIEVIDKPEKICEEFFRSDSVVKALEESEKKIKVKKENIELDSIKEISEGTEASIIEKTILLFKEGKTTDEIAEVRGLTKSTINEHLVKLIESDRHKFEFNINDFVKPGHQELIKNAIASVGDERLSDITDILPEEVSYDEIKIVRAFLRRSKIKECTEEKLHQERIGDKNLKEVKEDKDSIALTIFGLIESLNFHAGRTLLADIVIGSKSKKLINQDFHKLKYYGMFKEYRHKEMIGIIDQLIDKGYLTIKQSESTKFPRPLLYLTDLSKSALANKEEIELELPITIKDQIAVSKNPGLLSKLKHWRKKVANEKNIPPYCIFHDKTLIEISNNLPITKEGLMSIYGFGKRKIKQYGEDVLEIVVEYRSNGQNIMGHNEVVFDKNNKRSTSKPSRVCELGESNNPVVIPELIDYTNSKNANERRLSASALGKLARFKPEIYDALPSLIELLNDEKPQVRQYAAKALGKISHPKAIPHLQKLLSDEKYYNKKTAKYVLDNLNSISKVNKITKNE